MLNSGDKFTFDGRRLNFDGADVATVLNHQRAIDTGGDLNINLSSLPTTPGLKLEGGLHIDGTLQFRVPWARLAVPARAVQLRSTRRLQGAGF